MNQPPLPGDNHLPLLPDRLSPSRAGDYQQCPQLFYYKTICKLPTPPTVHTIKGNLAHYAFERIFDHPAGQRTVEVALPYVDQAWQAMRFPDLAALDEDSRDRAQEAADFAHSIAPAGSEEERQLLEATRTVVRNWFEMEKVNNFSPVDLALADGTLIDGREIHLAAKVGNVNLHGFVDRLDRWEGADGKVHWSISDYKGLALDTVLPTPHGWTTMEAVQVGQQILGRDGHPATVVGKSQVKSLPCYQLSFDDGSELVCDNEHLWEVTATTGYKDATLLVRADQLPGLLAQQARINQMLLVGLAAPLDLPARDLPASAVELGSQLVDSGASLLPDLWQQVARSSARQRSDVLLAAAAASGSWRATSGWVACASEAASNHCRELVHSLGGVVKDSSSIPDVDPSIVKEHWVFFELGTPARPLYRTLTAVKSVDSVPTQCIEVDSFDSMYLAGSSMVPTHNTGKLPQPRYQDKYWQQLRIYAVLMQELYGVTPSMLRLVFVSVGDRQKGILTEQVTEASLNATRKKMNDLWKQITSSARKGQWEPRTGPLCNWCHFQDICPAHQPGTDGLTLS